MTPIFPRRTVRFVFTELALLLCAPVILGQRSAENVASTQFSYADLQRLRTVHDVAISPEGRRVAYTVSATDLQRDRITESLWVRRIGEQQTSPTEVPESSAPAWSPNGEQLAVVHQGRAGESTIRLLNAETLQVSQSFAVPSSPGSLVWSPDGHWLAFTLFVADKADPSFLQEAVASAEASLSRPSGAEWAAPARLTQAARYRRDGGTWLQPGHSHLFVVQTATGQLHQVGSEPYDDSDPAWMADSATLLFTSDRRPERDHANATLAVFKTDLAGHAIQLTHTKDTCSSPTASPDGRWIAYTEVPYRQLNYTQSGLFLMHPDGTGAKQLAKDLDRDVYAPQWAADGKQLYAEFDNHGIFRIGIFDLNGHTKELASNIGGAYSVTRDGAIAYAGSNEASPDDLKLLLPGRAPESLTVLNGFLQQRQLGHLTSLHVSSTADGVPVEGWALLPASMSTHTRLPTIFAMHGGPFGSDGPQWSSKFQLLAAAGFAVVYANYRGSTSYGASFSEPANHDFPGPAFEDMMSIADEAVRRGFADPNRLFLIGGSAGGQLTAWITGKSNRFKAAVAEKPVTNLISDALSTDQYLASPEIVGGAPWAREKELWAHSPLALAGSMTTPTLFIVGEEDYRTPLDQSLQLYDALQLQNVPTALMRVPNAGHASLESRPSQLAAEIAASVAWFHHFDPSLQGK